MYCTVCTVLYCTVLCICCRSVGFVFAATRMGGKSLACGEGRSSITVWRKGSEQERGEPCGIVRENHRMVSVSVLQKSKSYLL